MEMVEEVPPSTTLDKIDVDREVALSALRPTALWSLPVGRLVLLLLLLLSNSSWDITSRASLEDGTKERKYCEEEDGEESRRDATDARVSGLKERGNAR